MWSDEEQDALLRRFYLAAVSGMNTTERRKAVRDFASFSVEIVAARGGTMTAEEVDTALVRLQSQGESRSERALRTHLTTQGAAVATLQAKVKELEEHNRVLHGEIGQWKRGSEISFHENQAVTRERDSLRRDLERLTQEIGHVRSRLLTAENERDGALARLQGLRQAIDDAVKRWGG